MVMVGRFSVGFFSDLSKQCFFNSALPIKTARFRIGMKHKLSKIETLKIACNYIRLLTNILNSDQEVDEGSFANSLAVGLNHTTANVVISSFQQISRFCVGMHNSPVQEF